MCPLMPFFVLLLALCSRILVPSLHCFLLFLPKSSLRLFSFSSFSSFPFYFRSVKISTLSTMRRFLPTWSQIVLTQKNPKPSSFTPSFSIFWMAKRPLWEQSSCSKQSHRLLFLSFRFFVSVSFLVLMDGHNTTSPTWIPPSLISSTSQTPKLKAVSKEWLQWLKSHWNLYHWIVVELTCVFDRCLPWV